VSVTTPFASSSLPRRTEARGVLVTIAVVGVVCLFLLPVPRAVLDVLLAINLTLSLVLLVRGLLIHEATQLFAFPTLLLLSTLFRLALNVSSTRLILLHGQQGFDAAGRVIQAFGEFVVQGDFLVGAIIFSVIALVNFIVVTKGAARVAEVSARFSLDAMPGKQLAIDADLRSGNITREEAERRRNTLNRESGFYGAMDGAMRFIQGDAIACLAIVVINVIGGSILGLTRGMDVEESLKRFGVLAIGDGLVSILPALLVSVCAGVVVTNVSRGRQETVSRQVLQTILSDRLALLVAGSAAIIFSLLPGFPFVPFVLVGAGCCLCALRPEIFDPWVKRLRTTKASTHLFQVLDQGGEPAPSLARLTSTGSVPRISYQDRPALTAVTVELGENGLNSIGGLASLEEAYDEERATFFEQRGVTLLPLRIQLRQDTPTDRVGVLDYKIFVRGRLAREGSCLVRQSYIRAMASRLLPLGAEIRAISRDPLLGCAGAWIEPEEKLESSLRLLGFESMRPGSFLAKDCIACQVQQLDELFGVDETKLVLSQLAESSPRLVEEFGGSSFLSPHELCSLFRSLIRGRVNIRDTKLILDGILEFASAQPVPGDSNDRAAWLEECSRSLRRKLRGVILDDLLGGGTDLRVFTLDPELTEELRETALHWDDKARPLPLDPRRSAELRRGIGRLFTPVVERGRLPAVILCDADIRDALDEFLATQRFSFGGMADEAIGNEWYRTLSFDEIGGRHRVETVGVLGS